MRAEALESSHSATAVVEVEKLGQDLDVAQYDLGRWQRGFAAKDLQFKKIVHDKLRELGVELDDSITGELAAASGLTAGLAGGIHGIEQEEEVKLGGLERHYQARIDKVYADSDAQIAAIMKR